MNVSERHHFLFLDRHDLAFYTFVHMKRAQKNLFKSEPSDFGGRLLKTRQGRARPRPLATKESMHLVLRSSLAKGDWSFRKGDRQFRIRGLVEKFAQKNGVRVFRLANVGNHLHLHIQLGSRWAYKPFIRGLTAAIAMMVTGRNKWTARTTEPVKFWDRRPFTRILKGRRSFLMLKDYVHINQLEGDGLRRPEARWILTLTNSITFLKKPHPEGDS